MRNGLSKEPVSALTMNLNGGLTSMELSCMAWLGFNTLWRWAWTQLFYGKLQNQLELLKITLDIVMYAYHFQIITYTFQCSILISRLLSVQCYRQKIFKHSWSCCCTDCCDNCCSSCCAWINFTIWPHGFQKSHTLHKHSPGEYFSLI